MASTVEVEVVGVWSDFGYDELELEVRDPETGVLYGARTESDLGRMLAGVVEESGPVSVVARTEALRRLPYQ